MKNDNEKLIKSGLILSIPSAVILFAMVVLDVVDTYSALSGYFSILILLLVFLIPFMNDFMSIKEYIKSIALGDKNTPFPKIESSTEEVKDMVKAINDMMNIWNTEANNLKAQTMTDAAVLAVLPYPLFLIDKKMKICGANLVALDIFGHSSKGREISKIINDNNFNEVIKKALKEQIKEKISLHITNIKERYFNVIIESLPTIAKDGAVVVVAFHDITSIKKNEKMQADFIANASHELKTPLSVISGFVETLQTSAKGDLKATEDFLKIMDSQAKRMNKLVTNLLKLSRIEAKDNIEFKEIDLINIVDNITSSLEYKAKDNNMTFNINLDENIKFFGDGDEISQVMQNLIDNALKYGENGTEVSISCKEDSDYKVISVKNFGNPIPYEHLSRLSERFYRVDSSSKSKAEGTGLGLSIVKSILNHHNARLWVSSNDKEGTEFSAIFPKN
ncbi:MAG: Alkaline phosphatase synthesis sensor protein PhoR [Alphaproteobacteria bacterium ADurb.Bin438]|nr:MAG: Alkaline phosphatase synthesis sensor protein PhoR [Alphaproteobacteria bacterium ADurb.Bin438]